jgi:hypothetical protein
MNVARNEAQHHAGARCRARFYELTTIFRFTYIRADEGNPGLGRLAADHGMVYGVTSQGGTDDVARMIRG